MTSIDSGMLFGLESAIRAHVLAHPCAADTIAGVQRWWLPRDLGHASTADLEIALSAIVATGALTKRRLPGGSVMYTPLAPAGTGRS